MTVRAAWLVNDTMSGEDIRLSQTAGMVHDTAIRSRSGVIPGPSNPLAVTIGSGMVVNVAAGQLSIGGQRAGAQGTYVITNDATLALTITNGDAAQPRTDAIVGYIRDTTYGDTTQVGGITVIPGTPGVSFPIPTYTGTTALGTAVLLGTVKVLANTTSGGGGLSGMGAILTDQRVYAAAAGGILVVRSQAEEDALPQYASLTIYRSDLTGWARFRVSNGTTFSPVAAGYVTSVKKTSITGVFLTESVVAGASVTFTAVAGRRYKVSYKVAAYDTGGACGVQFYLRDAGAGALTTSSTQLDLTLVDAGISGVVGFNQGVYEYVPGSSGVKTLGLTCIAVTAAASVNAYAAANAPISIIVEDMGV